MIIYLIIHNVRQDKWYEYNHKLHYRYFYINDNVDLNIKYSLRVKEFIYDPNLNVKKIHSTPKF